MSVSLSSGRRTVIPVVPTLAGSLAGQVDDEGVGRSRSTRSWRSRSRSPTRCLAVADARRRGGSGAVAGRSVARGKWDGPVAAIVATQRRPAGLESDRRRRSSRRLRHDQCERHTEFSACRFGIEARVLRTFDVPVFGAPDGARRRGCRRAVHPPVFVAGWPLAPAAASLAVALGLVRCSLVPC
jgi:hypothetical protein